MPCVDWLAWRRQCYSRDWSAMRRASGSKQRVPHPAWPWPARWQRHTGRRPRRRRKLEFELRECPSASPYGASDKWLRQRAQCRTAWPGLFFSCSVQRRAACEQAGTQPQPWRTRLGRAGRRQAGETGLLAGGHTLRRLRNGHAAFPAAAMV